MMLPEDPAFNGPHDDPDYWLAVLSFALETTLDYGDIFGSNRRALHAFLVWRATRKAIAGGGARCCDLRR